MSAQVHYPHEWTLNDLESLPDDGYRYEIVDGQLVVTPPPSVRHQLLADRYCQLLRAAGRHAVTAVGVWLPPALGRQESFVIPDVVATSEPMASFGLYVEPRYVTLAVEVVSPSTGRRDRVVKKDLYAELGIDRYVLVDPVEERVQEFDLHLGVYVELPWDLQTVTWVDLQP